MGFDRNALEFISYQKSKNPDFGRILMIGRQEMHLRNYQISSIFKKLGIRKSWFFTSLDSWGSKIYCDEFLREYLKVEKIDSLDNSNYEGASILHNLNLPVPKNLENQYDSIIDLGSTEHIFDTKMVYENYHRMLSKGGRLIQLLPANNYCGHGFYQFSPEFFFSVLSEKNGFEATEVFLKSSRIEDFWFRVNKPEKGKRVEINSPDQCYALVNSIKTDKQSETLDVQQSDYVIAWKNTEESQKMQSQFLVTRNTKNHISMRSYLNKFFSIFRSASRLHYSRNLLTNEVGQLQKVLIKNVVKN
jgi:hypothetical protein